MEIDEFEVITGFILLTDLLLSLNDLRFQRLNLRGILLNHNILLPEFILPVLDNLLGLYLPCTSVLPVDEDLSVKIEGVLSDFLNSHVRFIKNGLTIMR